MTYRGQHKTQAGDPSLRRSHRTNPAGRHARLLFEITRLRKRSLRISSKKGYVPRGGQPPRVKVRPVAGPATISRPSGPRPGRPPGRVGRTQRLHRRPSVGPVITIARRSRHRRASPQPAGAVLRRPPVLPAPAICSRSPVRVTQRAGGDCGAGQGGPKPSPALCGEIAFDRRVPVRAGLAMLERPGRRPGAPVAGAWPAPGIWALDRTNRTAGGKDAADLPA
jgi:hypothetical protein